MTSTEQGRRKYDALADRYEEIYFYVADVGRQLVSFAEPVAGARLLDVGAGRGAVARAALAHGCRVTAVDASAGMVSRLSADHPEITARQQNAGRLEFPDGSFDVVTAGFLVQVLTEPEVALTEFRRVLAPGGTVALSLERQSRPAGLAVRAERGVLRRRLGRRAERRPARRLTRGGRFRYPGPDGDRPPEAPPGPRGAVGLACAARGSGGAGNPARVPGGSVPGAVLLRRGTLHVEDGIVLEFGAILHRATRALTRVRRVSGRGGGR
ncbi:MAG: class I SAM-dependent methyltransferase [Pseudonocardiaceae bacterium]|nr:class I SAM-dependent methyltransferase [Pseudonocardiaceae bacterium]